MNTLKVELLLRKYPEVKPIFEFLDMDYCNLYINSWEKWDESKTDWEEPLISWGRPESNCLPVIIDGLSVFNNIREKSLDLLEVYDIQGIKNYIDRLSEIKNIVNQEIDPFVYALKKAQEDGFELMVHNFVKRFKYTSQKSQEYKAALDSIIFQSIVPAPKDKAANNYISMLVFLRETLIDMVEESIEILQSNIETKEQPIPDKATKEQPIPDKATKENPVSPKKDPKIKWQGDIALLARLFKDFITEDKLLPPKYENEKPAISYDSKLDIIDFIHSNFTDSKGNPIRRDHLAKRIFGESLKSIEKSEKNNKKYYLTWNWHVNQLVGLLYDLHNENEDEGLKTKEGKPYIVSRKKTIYAILCKYFKQNDGNPFVKDTLQTYMTPGNIEDRPKTDFDIKPSYLITYK